MSGANFSVKWKLTNQIRRFNVERHSNESKYNALVRHARELVGDQQFDITWKDSDGDDIVIGSERELEEAMKNCGDNLLRIFSNVTCNQVNNINFPSHLDDMTILDVDSTHDGQYLVVEKDFKLREENRAQTEICNLVLEDRNGETCQCAAFGNEAQRLNQVKEDEVVLFTDVRVDNDVKNFMDTSSPFQIAIVPNSGIHSNQQLSGKKNEWSTKTEIVRRFGRKGTLRFLGVGEVRDYRSPANSGSVLNSFWRTKDGKECQLALFDSNIGLLPRCLEKEQLYNIYGMRLADNQNTEYADLSLIAKSTLTIRKLADE